jgi:hypothetical protein
MWMSTIDEMGTEFSSAWAVLTDQWLEHATSNNTPLHIAGSLYELLCYKGFLLELRVWAFMQQFVPINWPTPFQGTAQKLHQIALQQRKCAQLYGR